jgi:hypothetical protein
MEYLRRQLEQMRTGEGAARCSGRSENIEVGQLHQNRNRCCSATRKRGRGPVASSLWHCRPPTTTRLRPTRNSVSIDSRGSPHNTTTTTHDPNHSTFSSSYYPPVNRGTTPQSCHGPVRSPSTIIQEAAGLHDAGFKKGVNRATTQVLMKTGQVERTNDRDFETEQRYAPLTHYPCSPHRKNASYQRQHH